MKPQNKLQHRIIALKEKLPKISKTQTDWAYKKIFKNWAYKTKHTCVCFECGHGWKLETNLISRLFPIVCPSCGKELEIRETKSWSHVEKGYFQIKTMIEGFQVIRMVYIHHYMKKGYKASYFASEVYQHWIAPNGKFTILGKMSSGMGEWRYGYPQWSHFSPLEVKSQHDRFFQNDIPEYPRRKIMPEIIRNGWSGEYFKWNHGYFFHLLLSYPKFETLLKTGQYELLKEFESHKKNIEQYWLQIKICIRNNYKVLDVSMWFDNMQYLEYFHYDMSNPKYVCPKNLKKFHQELIERKEEIDNKKELIATMEKIQEAEKQYRIDKAKFIGMRFNNGEIDMFVLPSVLEFYLEGKALHHCVFQNEYYKTKNSLILSARKGEERLETIEVSLANMKVMQVHGNKHKPSKYHKEVLKLLEDSLPLIAEKVTKRKRKIKEVA